MWAVIDITFEIIPYTLVSATDRLSYRTVIIVLNAVIQSIKTVLIQQGRYNDNSTVVHGPERNGDIRHSLADISETIRDLNYQDYWHFDQGMKEYLSN